MHQPPTIPEGDEENEGFEQIGEGTRFPQTGSQQQPSPSVHDTIAASSDLQPPEDESAAHEQMSALQEETIAEGDGVTTEADQEAEHDEASAAEKPPTDDTAEEGTEQTADGEQQSQGQTDEEGALTGIKEGEGTADESAAAPDGEAPSHKADESSMLQTGESLTAAEHITSTDEQIKHDELAPVSFTSVFL